MLIDVSKTFAFVCFWSVVRNEQLAEGRCNVSSRFVRLPPGSIDRWKKIGSLVL